MASPLSPPDLFVSYASTDRERVVALVEQIERVGVTVWLDREGISGGASYALEIAEAIEGARAILLMCSEASLSSRNVKQEIALGWRFEKPYLPLLLEPVEIPKDIAYWLEAAQWVEILDLPRNDWLPKILAALSHLGIETQLPEGRAVHPSPVLVGREREQAALRQHLDAMRRGHGNLVLVSGEAGIGKTTLVEWLAHEADAAGCLVLRGSCYDLTVTPPYGPWVEALRSYQPSGNLPPLPSFVTKASALAELQNQDMLFTQVARFLSHVATVQPLILILDDMQWADPGSLEFLRLWARSISPQRVLAVVTHRSDAATQQHPLGRLLPLLVREARASRLELARLDVLSIKRFVTNRYELDDNEAGRLSSWLNERGEGNPFFLQELARTLEEQRVLVEATGEWRLGDLTEVRVPGLVRQVIEARLDQLDDRTRELLQVGAVVGQDVPLDLWRQAAQASDDELVSTLKQARTAHILEETARGTAWRFSHALIRETLYEDLVALQRQHWHRRVAEALEASETADPDAIAAHYQSGHDARAIEWLVRSGERAERTFAWQTASDRFNTASELLAADSSRRRERAWLLYRSAQRLQYAAPAQRIARLEGIQLLAEEIGDELLAERAEFELGLAHCFLSDIRSGLELMAHAVATLATLDLNRDPAPAPGADEGALIMQQRGDLALWLGPAGRLHECIALGEPFVAEIELDANNQTRLLRAAVVGRGYALAGMAEAHSGLGHPDHAKRLFEEARRVFESLHYYHMESGCLYRLLTGVFIPFYTERIEERAAVVRQAEEVWRRGLGILSPGTPTPTQHLPLLYVEGRWAEVRALEPHIPGAHGNVGRRNILWLALGNVMRAQGDFARAWECVQTVMPDGLGAHPGNSYLENDIGAQQLATALALDAGDLPKARVWLEAHDRWLAWSGAVLGQADGALGWAAYHHAAGDLALARVAADQALASASNPRQPLALLAAHRFLGRLHTKEARFDDAETHLHESRHLARACGSPFEQALTVLQLAELRLAQHRPADANTCLDEVHAICEPLEARPALERVSVLRNQLS